MGEAGQQPCEAAAQHDQRDDAGQRARQQARGRAQDGWREAQADAPAHQRVAGRQQPPRQLDRQQAGVLQHDTREQRHEQAAGRNAQAHRGPGTDAGQRQRLSERRPMQRQVVRDQRRRRCVCRHPDPRDQGRHHADQQHAQILHQRHQAYVGPEGLGHQHHRRRGARERAPDRRRSGQQAPARHRPPEAGAQDHHRADRHDEQRPRLADLAQQRQGNGARDHAADDRLSEHERGRGDAHRRLARREEDRHGDRAQQQRRGDVQAHQQQRAADRCREQASPVHGEPAAIGCGGSRESGGGDRHGKRRGVVPGSGGVDVYS